MAGKSLTSEKFEMRVPKDELADWRRRAAALSISVAELIRLKMRQPDAPAAADPAPKPVDLDALEKEWRRKWEGERPEVVSALPIPPSRGPTKTGAKARRVAKALKSAQADEDKSGLLREDVSGHRLTCSQPASKAPDEGKIVKNLTAKLPVFYG